MSFPHTIYGNFGDEKVVDATKKYEYGQRMELKDGRIFRYGKAGATALVAGKLYSGASGYIGSDTMFVDNMVPDDAAVGATAVVISAAGTTATTLGAFDEGYIFTASSANSGVGEVYKIKTAASVAVGASADVIVKLADGESIHTAWLSGTTKVGLRANEYHILEIVPATTVFVNSLAGVAPVAIPASSFGWIQRRGVATYYSESSTLAANGAPMGPAHSFAGAMDMWIGVTSSVQVIGQCVTAAATSKRFGLINLNIE